MPSSRSFSLKNSTFWFLAPVFMSFCLGPLINASGQERVFVTGVRLTLGTETNLSASARIADLDDDKDLDVVIANGRHWPQQNFLFLNQDRARFNVQRNLGIDRATTYATELADLDGDGDVDIAVGNDWAPNLIFLNDGTGKFDSGTEFGDVTSVRSLTLADLDRDNDIDIVMTCRGRQNRFYLNNGKAKFGTGYPFGGRDDSTIDVAVADFNLDGHPDLVLANRDGQQNYILLNEGQAKFEKRIPFGTGKDQTRAVAVCDLNADGKPDIVTGNIGEANGIYFGDGKSKLKLATRFGRSDGKSYAITTADMNNDGSIDIVVGNAFQ